MNLDLNNIYIKDINNVNVEYLENKKKLKVAVIDSGINLEHEFFTNYNIESYTYVNNSFIRCYEDNTDKNAHGTIVTSCLLKECSYLDILSIKILDTENKCSLNALINSLKFSIEQNVNIINLSLGVDCSLENCLDLKLICEEANKKGILIFAAENNEGKRTYPCNFKNVTRVTSTSNENNRFLTIDKNDTSIILNNVYIGLDHLNMCSYTNRNSFLCPYIVGIFCRYIYHFNLNLSNSNIISKFYDFMENLSINYNNKIFKYVPSNIKKISTTCFKYIPEEGALTDDIYKNLLIDSLFDFEVNDLFESSNVKTYTNLKNLTEDRVFFIGEMPLSLDIKEEIIKLILLLRNRKVGIILENAILNTFDRYLLCKTFSKNINCHSL